VKEYLRVVFGDNAKRPAKTDPLDGASSRGEGGPGGLADPAATELDAFLAGGTTDAFSGRPGYNRDETRLGDGRAVTCDYLVTSRFGPGPLVPAREPFRIRVRYYFPVALDRLIFGVRICTVTGLVVYSSNTLVSDGRLFACDAGTVALGEFDLRCSLLRGQYFVTVGVSCLDADGREVHAIDRRSDSIILTVSGDGNHAEGLADMEAAFALTGAQGRIGGMV
jgi:lipopolysaccharide transport system ATP-binding protein